VVSFLPIVLLTATGILKVNDIRGLPYDVLFLIAGGLALGQMVTGTGLADWLVQWLPFEGVGIFGLGLGMAFACAILSTFMSNTAAANILIPIGVTLAAGAEAHVAVPIALGASAAMCLPIATPPNALVFATGQIRTLDFLRMGLFVGILVPLIGTAWAALMLNLVLKIA
jgi:sodium-dependent dicarboxylate transporter 2/3/5